MKNLTLLLSVPLFLAFLFVGRIAVRSYLGERADFLRTPQTALSRHPERAGIADLREISIRSDSAPELAGWYAPGSNHAAVILIHGTGAERTGVLAEMKMLSQGGFGVLALDLPGQGASGGVSRWGHAERQSISVAVDWLSNQPGIDPKRIGALGQSMGGYILVQAAVLDSRLRAIVLESAPSDVVEQTRVANNRWGPLSQWPSYWALRASGMPLDMRPRDIVSRIAPRAILIIGGELDTVVPSYMASQLFQAAGEPKQLWIAPRAHHVDYVSSAPAEFSRRVLGFFQRYLAAN